jgi:DNA-binding GntR family transcriptional regulator
MKERRLVTVEIDSARPLRELVFDALRNAILDGVIKPGERLLENQLAEELGVSRTPVREAIRKLELEGFAVILPRKGAYVSEISFKDVREVYEIRAALEALASGLAAERVMDNEVEEMERRLIAESANLENEDNSLTVEADVDLHELIYKATRNEKLISLISNLKEQVYRLRSTSITLPGRKKRSLDEHKRIVEAIAEHNIKLAQRLAHEHIEHAEQAMLKVMGNNADNNGKGKI